MDVAAPAPTPNEVVVTTTRMPGAQAAVGASPNAAAGASHFWAGNSFSFHDILDALNPLQHIPIVSTIYRAVTGDTIGNAARVAGDTLYGGVIGLAAGLIDTGVKEATGKDIGENAIALVSGSDTDTRTADTTSQAPIVLAAATPAPFTPVPSTPVPSTSAPSAPAPVPDSAWMPHKPGTRPTASAAPPALIPLNRNPPPTLIPLAAAPSGLKPLVPGAVGIPIDTSAKGILASQATAAMHSAPPIPLDMPGNTLPASAIPLAPADFAERMKAGLDKYQQMMADRDKATSTVDQTH